MARTKIRDELITKQPQQCNSFCKKKEEYKIEGDLHLKDLGASRRIKIKFCCINGELINS